MFNKLQAFAKSLYEINGLPYHNWQHIQQMLYSAESLLRDVAPHPEISKLVSLAILYHDCVFVPGSPLNEINSAKMYLQVLDLLHDADLESSKDYVTSLITLTSKHMDRLSREDFANHLKEDYTLILAGKVMMDADLASMGGLPHECSLIASSLFLESNLSFKEYIPKRIAFLDCMLNKPSIFYTQKAKELWEVAARENLLAERERLLEGTIWTSR